MGVYDAGGGSVVHAFGAYFGIMVNFILSKYAFPANRPEKNYYSNLIGLLGTLFLWVFWPFFNFGFYANNSYERTIIVINTYCGLACSTLAVIAVSAMYGKGLLVQDLQHGTIVGGVAVAASCGIVYIPAVSSTIGFIGGVISAKCIHYLDRKLEKSAKIVDPHSVHSTHGLPALFGIIVSGIIVMVYASGYDFAVAANYAPGTIFFEGQDFMKRGGMQIISAFSALGIALVFGFMAGKFIGLFYEER